MTIQEFENNNFTLKNLNASIDNYINRVKADMIKFSYNRDYCRYLKGMLDGLYTAKNAAVNLNIIIFEDEEDLDDYIKEKISKLEDELEIKSYLVEVNCFSEDGEEFRREFIVKAINEEEATHNVLNDCTLGLGYYSCKIINVELY